jgi:AmmeMemoRadiSam system protein A
MPLPESHPPAQPFSLDDQATLLRIAFDSIRHGQARHRPLAVTVADFPAPLQEQRAAFVTLQINHRLRGCIGSLEARQPLVVDVAQNAFAAAFRDPRFAALGTDELTMLECHISVLSAPTAMDFVSEPDLLAQLRVGVDGLVLEEDGGYRGTFLPAVWESLSAPAEFLSQLKLKAGLPVDYWSDTLRVLRYETSGFQGCATTN